jgi:hypothetical protein
MLRENPFDDYSFWPDLEYPVIDIAAYGMEEPQVI